MKHTITALFNKLKTYGEAYNMIAPGTAGPIYAVFDFTIPLTEFETQSGELRVNIWSNTLAGATELADTIWKGMNHYTYSDANTTFSVRQELLNTIPDVDENIHRRQLTFLVLFEEV